MMNDEKLSFPCVPWCVVVVPVNEASNDRATSSTLSSHHLSFHTHFFKIEKYSKKKFGENSRSCQNYMALLIELGPVMYFNLYDAVQPTQVCCAVNLVT